MHPSGAMHAGLKYKKIGLCLNSLVIGLHTKSPIVAETYGCLEKFQGWEKIKEIQPHKKITTNEHFFLFV